MRNPFRRHPAVVPGAQLSGPDGRRASDHVVVPIDTPDQKIPADFELPDLDPIREELYRRIDATAERGGLDAGNAAFADSWIDDQLADWLQQAQKVFGKQLHVASQVIGALLQNLTREQLSLGKVQEKVTFGMGRERAYLEELLGDAVQEGPVSTAELHRVLGDLPTASQFDGLELIPRAAKPVLSQSTGLSDHNWRTTP